MIKYMFTLGCLLLSSFTNAGTGKGTVIDITLRSQDNVLAVRVSSPGEQHTCVRWFHTYAFDLDKNPVIGASYLGMLTTAKNNGYKVQIKGTGTCLEGTAGEEIREINIGPWGN